MSFKVIIPPAAEILSAEDLRPHVGLGAGESDWDTLLNGYIAAARSKAESYLRQRLITQTILATFDSFPRNGTIILPVGPAHSVSKIEVRDAECVWQDVPSESYRAYLSDFPGLIRPLPGSSWPVLSAEPENLRVTYVAGVSDTSAGIDPAILQAIRLMVADDFFNRGDEAQKASDQRMHPGAEALLSDHREWV
jgi:uncharacterized phiE125 gp8 family phage protein